MTARPPADRVELSVVVPMYNEAAGLDAFFERVESVLGTLGLNWEIVAVNDGSRDGTLERLVAHHHREPRVKVVDLSRNFGKEAALTCGIEHATGRAVVPIDADLQDPPEVIPRLVERWREGYDVVLATRTTREGETWLKRATASAFYRLIRRVSPTEIPANTGDFRLLDRRAVEALALLRERNRFMKGLLSWSGFRQAVVTYERAPRHAGRTTWSYWRLWNFALDGIFSFSNLPLQVWTYLGLSISGLAFLYALFVVLKTLVRGVDEPGYASLMVVLLFLGGIQLLSLGVIAEYIGRIYNETKGRPIYLVRETLGLEDSDTKPAARS